MAAALVLQITQCKAEIEKYQTKIDEIRANKSDCPLADMAEQKNVANTNIVSKMKMRKTLTGHYGKVYGLDWGPDAEKLVSAAQDGKLIIWNAMHEVMLHAIQLRSSWVMTCAYSPDGNYIASGGLDNLCSVFKIDHDNAANTQGAQNELAQHEGYLSCCRFVGNSEMLTSSGDATCLLWDIPTSKAKVTFADHENDVMSIAHYEGNEWFVSGSCDSTAKLWDYRAGNQCIKTFAGHESDVNSIRFLPGGQAFGTVSEDSTCRLFDIRSYGPLNRYNEANIVSGITSLAFSRSGRVLFAGYDDYNCLAWDTLTGQQVQQLTPTHENRVSCIGVNTTGQALATGSWTQQVKIWA